MARMDWAIQDAGALTSMADDHTSHVAWLLAPAALTVRATVRSFATTTPLVPSALPSRPSRMTTAWVWRLGRLIGAIDIIGLGVKYTADLGGTALNVGLAYQSGNLDDPFTRRWCLLTRGAYGHGRRTATCSACRSVLSWLPASRALGYLSSDFDASTTAARNDFDHTGLALTYTTGALSMHFNYGVANPEDRLRTSTPGVWL